MKEYTPNLRDDVDSLLFRKLQSRYLTAAGISSKGTAWEKNVSHDRNLLGDEWEEATIANTDQKYDLREEGLKELHEDKTTLPIGVRFKDGKPVALKVKGDDWQELSPLEFFKKLNKLGLDRRIGIVDHVEERPPLKPKEGASEEENKLRQQGINAREIHIAPAMNILYKAHYHLRSNCIPREKVTKLNKLSLDWSRWVMEKNLHTHPLVRTMDRTFRAFDKGLDGEVFMELEPEKVANITSEAANKYNESTRIPAGEEDVAAHAEAADCSQQIPAAYQNEMDSGVDHATAMVRALRKAGRTGKEVLLENTLRRVTTEELQISM